MKISKLNFEKLESRVPFFARSTVRDESEKTNDLKRKGKGQSKNTEIWLQKLRVLTFCFPGSFSFEKLVKSETPSCGFVRV